MILLPKTSNSFTTGLSKTKEKTHQNAEFGFHSAKNSWSISA